LSRIEELIRGLLEEIGEDPTRQGLLRTPTRVAQSLKFLTQGYLEDPVRMRNQATFEEGYNEMVVVRDIDFYSM